MSIGRLSSRKKFEKNTIKYLRDFILDKGISATDSIALHESMFDELALDFRQTYNESIPNPFVFLGIWIKIADKGDLKYNQVLIIENDPPPLYVKSITEEVIYQEVHRCGWCGKLLDEQGDELKGDAFEMAVKQHKIYGEGIWIKTTGNCCRNREK